MNSQKRFTIGGFHAPYSLAEIQDTPEVIAAIDRLNIGESWDDGNGSETVTRIADADDVVLAELMLEQIERRRNAQFGFRRFFMELYVSDPSNVFDSISMRPRPVNHA